ncbi:hypothetical protein AVEN_202314-1 [Araneus ventricosus]|uniref:Uncharacterized protein n=1 Tax=Araneus ventricosus TaxID=182803 RepID=A0A4Y2E902_ARAVE|nr:hypothetical protein AVEN_202314-1 [Araneus ventricosus]
MGRFPKKFTGLCSKERVSSETLEVVNLSGVCPLAPWPERKPATLSPRPSQQTLNDIETVGSILWTYNRPGKLIQNDTQGCVYGWQRNCLPSVYVAEAVIAYCPRPPLWAQ